jgi:DNA-binding beta-propeller fold protein YncE
MKPRKALSLLALVLIVSTAASAQFAPDFSSAGAGEQFRLGVQAYQKGRYSEAILLFEKSLAYEPDQPLVSFWLGRSYLKSGFESTALRAWDSILGDPSAPPFIRAKAEGLRSRRIAGDLLDDSATFVEMARFEGKKGRTTYFLRPSAILPQRDGSVLVVAQGSDSILVIDPNGVIRSTEKGGLQGLDRPFGLASLPDGTFFVTEFNGDRISRLGNGKALTFGTKGRGAGQVLGPQYAVCDEDGYLYVSDYGNTRILKFDADGNFLFAFGLKSEDFPGFVSPSGLAERDGILYAADSFRKSIYRFDLSGNFLGVLAEGAMHFPEGLSFWKDGSALLVADTDRILSIDLETETPTVVYQSPDRKARIVGAAPDYNGNLLACDFDASAILVLTEAPLIAAGYDVEIERVMAEAFPKVTLDISVRDRLGHPVVGLKEPNFHLSERITKKTTVVERGKSVIHTEESLVPVSRMEFVGSATMATPVRVSFLLERSPAMPLYLDSLRETIAALHGAFPGKAPASFSLVSAGPVPSQDVPLGGSVSDLTRSLLKPAQDGGRFDLGLRLAASNLLPTGPRDAVVYLGTGAVDDASFGATTLFDLASLLQNNGIRFYAIIVGDNVASPALRYLVEASGGAIYSASRPRGMGDVAADIAGAASGRYRISFTSTADSGFGENYLTVAAEAYLYEKSGRDELGYYAPLR